MSRPKPLVLVILDGWGYAPPSQSNAISLARKPIYDRLLAEFPNTLIHTSGRYVGLPDEQMGNSEVGHLNMGAGRVVYMDQTRIDLMIENGDFFSNPVLLAAMKHAKTGGRWLHIFGLLSDGGVHSHQEHLYALLRIAREYKLERVDANQIAHVARISRYAKFIASRRIRIPEAALRLRSEPARTPNRPAPPCLHRRDAR